MALSNKYSKMITGHVLGGETVSVSIDIYDVLKAYEVRCPAMQHAIKKLLMPGQRGHKSLIDDLHEAKQSIDRAIALAGVS